MNSFFHRVTEKIAIILAVSIVFVSPVISQWDQYMATWEGKEGAVVLNMSWGEIAPVEELPFVTVISFRSYQCDDSGLPKPEEYERIDSLSTGIINAATQQRESHHLATMNYDCEIKEFFYSRDTLNLRNELLNHPMISMMLEKPAIEILHDPEWKVYRFFLYPDKYLRESMSNEKVIREIIQPGEDPRRLSRLTHRAEFKSEEEMNKFRVFVLEQGFRIEDTSKINDPERPFLIVFSRRDQLLVDPITEISIRLSERAESLSGVYDGWEASKNK